MATLTEAPGPVTTAMRPVGSRRRRGWRDLRGMLLAVAVFLVASTVAVVIAYAVQGSSGPAGDIQASTVDYKVRLPATLSSGKHTIGFTNDGAVGHEIVIFKTALPADQLPLRADGDVDEESPLLTNVADSGDPLKPGGTESFATAALAPGRYVAVCNLPGHYGLGMRMDVTVR